ncbi:MAG TPA: hypothetical protein VFU42_00650 [Candidatus Deferrimicrobiaceae bacterium]|nr:hypothetical protein [Candidatus Deferrimicrobiaceae bacterium]
MILVRVDPIFPAASGTPGVTVMTPMPAAATPASEHEEEEQSSKEQPDQPSSHQRSPLLSVFRLADYFLHRVTASAMPIRQLHKRSFNIDRIQPMDRFFLKKESSIFFISLENILRDSRICLAFLLFPWDMPFL